MPLCWAKLLRGAHCVGRKWVCRRLRQQSLFYAQNGTHCARVARRTRAYQWKTLVLTFPQPLLCHPNLPVYGYNADFCHSWPLCPVLLKQKLLFCALKAWTQRNKAAWKTSLREGVWAPFKVKNTRKTKHFPWKMGFHAFVYTHMCICQNISSKCSQQKQVTCPCFQKPRGVEKRGREEILSLLWKACSN